MAGRFEDMLTGGHPNSLGRTIEVLSDWANGDAGLKAWILPHLERLSNDPWKSVAKRASRKLKQLSV